MKDPREGKQVQVWLTLTECRALLFALDTCKQSGVQQEKRLSAIKSKTLEGMEGLGWKEYENA